MVDLSTDHIKQLFNQRVLEMTKQTLNIEDSFDVQFSGGWI